MTKACLHSSRNRLQHANSIGDKRVRLLMNEVSNELKEKKKLRKIVDRDEFTCVVFDKYPRGIVRCLLRVFLRVC